MKKSYVLFFNIFFISLFLCIFSAKTTFASEPSVLYNNNILMAKLSKEKAKKQIAQSTKIEKKKQEKTPRFKEYFANNFENLLKNNTFKNHFFKYKDRISKKFRERKRIKKQNNWWWLLDLFFQSPGTFLFFLIALVLSIGIWYLFTTLGATIAFEIALIIGLVITLVGYIIVLWS